MQKTPDTPVWSSRNYRNVDLLILALRFSHSFSFTYFLPFLRFLFFPLSHTPCTSNAHTFFRQANLTCPHSAAHQHSHTTQHVQHSSNAQSYMQPVFIFFLNGLSPKTILAWSIYCSAQLYIYHEPTCASSLIFSIQPLCHKVVTVVVGDATSTRWRVKYVILWWKWSLFCLTYIMLFVQLWESG